MAKSTRVTIELPPASYALLQQAAQENGINAAAAASLILQAALTRRVSGLVPKRPKPRASGPDSRATAETTPANPGGPAAPGTRPSPRSPDLHEG